MSLPRLLCVRVGFWIGALWMCAPGCGESRPPTVASAVDAARATHYRALERAWTAVESAAPYALPARYNPAPCECPEFEVYYLGSWHRVVLTGSTAALEGLRARLAGKPPASETAQVLGAPTGAAQRSFEGGQLFAVFELEALVAE